MEIGPVNAGGTGSAPAGQPAKPSLLQGLKNLLVPDPAKEGWRVLDLKGVYNLVLGPKDPLAPGASAESGRLLGRKSSVDNRLLDPLSASLAKLRLNSPMGDRGQQPLAVSLKDTPLHLKSQPRPSAAEQVKNDPILRSDQRTRDQQAVQQPQQLQQQQSHGLREVPVYDSQGRIVSGAPRETIRSVILRSLLNTLELIITGLGFLAILPFLLLLRGWRLVRRPDETRPKPGAGMASR